MRGIEFKNVDPEYKAIFDFQNLVKVISWDYLLFPEPTLLFYLHLERWDKGGTKGIKTYLFGEDIVITEDEVVEFCGGFKEGWSARRNDSLPGFLAKLEPRYRKPDSEVARLLTGDPNIPLKAITLAKQLCPLAKNLEKLIRDNLVPKHGDKTSLTLAPKIILFCLLAQVPIAFPLLMFENMLDIKKVGGQAVGYGQLITRLLKKKYSSIDFLDLAQPQADSDAEEKQAMDQGEPEPEVAKAARSTHAEDWEAMQLGMDSMQSRLDGLGNIVERQGFEMHAMGHLMKKMGKHFGISSSKGMNRLLQIDPSSTVHYVPQANDDDGESPPAASKGSGDDGGNEGADGGAGGDDIADLEW